MSERPSTRVLARCLSAAGAQQQPWRLTSSLRERNCSRFCLSVSSCGGFGKEGGRECSGSQSHCRRSQVAAAAVQAAPAGGGTSCCRVAAAPAGSLSGHAGRPASSPPARQLPQPGGSSHPAVAAALLPAAAIGHGCCELAASAGRARRASYFARAALGNPAWEGAQPRLPTVPRLCAHTRSCSTLSSSHQPEAPELPLLLDHHPSNPRHPQRPTWRQFWRGPGR